MLCDIGNVSSVCIILRMCHFSLNRMELFQISDICSKEGRIWIKTEITSVSCVFNSYSLNIE